MLNYNLTARQLPADWDHYFDWLDLTPEEFAGQQAYVDSIAYLRLYSVPTPDLLLSPIGGFGAKMGCEAIFHINARDFGVSAIALIFNPMMLLTDLMHAGLIPQSNGPLIPFVPVTRLPIKPRVPDLSDLSKSVGMILNGYITRTRALVAAFQGKVDLGTEVDYLDGRYKLVESGSLWNRSGVWELIT